MRRCKFRALPHVGARIALAWRKVKAYGSGAVSKDDTV